jgi:hypothetical protein
MAAPAWRRKRCTSHVGAPFFVDLSNEHHDISQLFFCQEHGTPPLTERARATDGADVKDRPGLKWLMASLALIAIGLLLGLVANTILAIPLLILGALGTIGWRSPDDFRRGWPPWPFAARRS